VSRGNARTTIHGRLLIVTRHRQGWRQARIAAAMGISRRCVGKWIDRFASEGLAGLQDRSSRPHTMPKRASADLEARVVQLRRDQRRGRGVPGPRHRLLRRPRHHPDRTPHHRQRLRLSLLATHAVCRARHLPEVHPTALPVAERESRSPQPHPRHRMDLPTTLHQQRPAHRSPCPLARALQH